MTGFVRRITGGGFRRVSRPHRPGFELVLRRPEAPDEVWERLWNLGRHTAAVPLTIVRQDDWNLRPDADPVAAGIPRTAPASASARPLKVGSRFVARTSLGPLHLDDVMVVRHWQPPQRAVVEKTGRLLRGRIDVAVDADGPGSLVVWRQEVSVVSVPGILVVPLVPLVARGYRASLQKILD